MHPRGTVGGLEHVFLQAVRDRVVLARVHVNTRHAAKLGSVPREGRGQRRHGFSAVGFEQLLAEALQSAQSAYNMPSALMVAGLTVFGVGSGRIPRMGRSTGAGACGISRHPLPDTDGTRLH